MSLRPFLFIAVLAAVLTGCAAPATEAPPTEAPPTEAPPTATAAPPTPTPVPTEEPTPTPEPLIFDGDRAMEHVEAQVAIGPRPTGSEASYLTGEYILEELEALGWRTESLPFDYLDVTGRNLVGKSGDPGGPVYIFAAHYDTRIFADEDPNFPEAPVMGANDGASGVAVLLELARVLDLSAVDGEVWLVFFDAEDNGRIGEWDWIVGSTIFVENLQITPEYAIIVDMVGDADQNIYYERNSDAVLSQHLWSIAGELGYEEYIIPSPKYSILDDHIPFLRAGIPAANMIDFDYPYWHTVEDTIDKVSGESLERVGRVVEVFIEAGAAYPRTEE